ncbi:MAG: hypothetical protein R3E14_14830 [Erythrobacter sp.]
MRDFGVLQRNIALAALSKIDFCDERLSYPPPSTGKSGESGKLGSCSVAESVREAQLQLIGTARKPTGFEGPTT